MLILMIFLRSLTPLLAGLLALIKTLSRSPIREDNLDSSNYSPTLGLQTRMTNRAYRSIELFDEYEEGR